MARIINYDFSKMQSAFVHLKSGKIDRALKELKTELNNFFKDSECRKVIYTNNKDKMFFGMTTYAILTNEEVDDIINNDNPVRVAKYSIEIDSKLIDYGFDSGEMTAILLHEVGHLVNDSSPAEEVRKAIDIGLARAHKTMDTDKQREAASLFNLAITDSIYKITSFFTKNDEEILADEFVYLCGYGKQLESALKRLKGSALNINKDVENKFITLKWVLRIYTNMGMYRYGAIKTLNRISDLTGSILEKDRASAVSDELKTVKPSAKAVSEATILAESHDRKNGLLHKIRRSGLRGIEQDLYEYQMRIRNVTDESEAIVLMRQINSRMAVLEDYLYNSQNLDPKEERRWESVLDKYEELRNQLSARAVYNQKQYGLFIDYNYADSYGSPTGDMPYLR